MDRHARTQRHTYTHAHIHTRDIKCVPPQNVMPQDVAIGFVLAVITQGTHYVAIGAFAPSYLCLIDWCKHEPTGNMHGTGFASLHLFGWRIGPIVPFCMNA